MQNIAGLLSREDRSRRHDPFELTPYILEEDQGALNFHFLAKGLPKQRCSFQSCISSDPLI